MPGPQPPRSPRRKSLGGAARLLLLVLVVTGFGVVASRSEATPETGPTDGTAAEAERAIQALLDPEHSVEALALLPGDFTTVTGVETAPELARDGTVRAVHAGGGCSAPWGDDSTAWDFGTPCRSHDLGYDLLRYAEKKNEPLAPSLREDLDERLSQDMYATCDANPQGTHSLCQGVAAMYTAGLVANSWHQRWGPPVGEPLLPLLAGVAIIGLLLWHRLRDRLLAASVTTSRPRFDMNRWTRSLTPTTPWTSLAATSVVLLILAESAVALTRWAGADSGWLWPLTWLAQTAVLFFFATGHANAATWSETSYAGGRVRTYLAHRGSWLLRLTLVFAVVAFTVPLALELLHVPASTIEGVMRIALHPLWLLGIYVITVLLTPLMLALHRRAPRAVPVALALLLAGAEWLGTRTTSAWPDHGGTLALALLAQQAAFAHRDGFVPSRRQLVLLGGAGLGALLTGVATGVLPFAVLGAADTPPALAGPTTAVLLVGMVHLACCGLLRGRLAAAAHRPLFSRTATLVVRAPMSLYLLFLTVILLLVAAVYLPARLATDLTWLQLRAVLATALLAVPAVLVFHWFERNMWHRPLSTPVWSVTQGGLDRVLSHTATITGFGFAILGVFGFAVTTLHADWTALQGLVLNPVQSLVHLLLGMSLLHSVRSGTTGAPGTWALAAIACVPPLLSVTSAPAPDMLGVTVHTMVALIAATAAATTTVSVLRTPGRRLRG